MRRRIHDLATGVDDITGCRDDVSSPGAFAVSPVARAMLPHTLAPGDTLLLDVQALSQAANTDAPTGSLQVEATATDGTPLTSTTALRYLSDSGPQLDALWGDFEDIGEVHLCLDADRAILLAFNYGDRTLDREAFRIEGPGAGVFTLEAYPGDTIRRDGHGARR